MQAEAQGTRADQGAPTATPAKDGPPVYLGMRRGWWVAVSLLVLVGVDLIPMVGPYLSLVALMWMISGLTRAEPRPERTAPGRPAAAVRRAAQPSRSTHAERGAALPSS